jgi:hypothetical protein
MWRLAALLTCLLAWAADEWQKVRDLKANSEVRVYQKQSTKPLAGKITGATDRKLILVTKNEVLSLNKADIDRVEYHPPRQMTRTQTSESTNDGSSTGDSSSLSYSWSREGWQTIYQRPSGH